MSPFNPEGLADMFPPSVTRICADCPPRRPKEPDHRTVVDWVAHVNKLVARLVADTPHHLHQDLLEVVISATACGGMVGAHEMARRIVKAQGER